MTNALLARYRAEGAAGGYKGVRALDKGSVASALRETGNQYGTSHAAYESWKRAGIPTNEVMQSTTFGSATVKGDTAGDALTFTAAAAQAPPFKQHHAEAASRANPITWEGAAPEGRPGLSPYANAAINAAQREAYGSMPLRSGQTMSAPPQQSQPQLPSQQHAPTGGQLSPNEMQETWGQLMRSGKMRGSAAQCLVEMPPEYSYEAPPKPPPISSQSLLTIGLHGHNRPVKRSTAFTSDFRDPFM